MFFKLQFIIQLLFGRKFTVQLFLFIGAVNQNPAAGSQAERILFPTLRQSGTRCA